jgi:hypothetical protein
MKLGVMLRWMYTVLLAGFCFPTLAISYANQLHVEGDATEMTTGKLIPKTSVYVLSGADTIYNLTTPQKAIYSFELDLDRLYTIRFVKAGYVSKFIEIDTREIPEEKAAKGFEMKVDITLFKQYSGFDYSILDREPIAKAKYLKKTEVIDWDLAYTKKMLKLLEKLNRNGQKAQIKKAKAKANPPKKEKKNNSGINPDKIKKTDDICHEKFYGDGIKCTRYTSPSTEFEGGYKVTLTIVNPYYKKPSEIRVREKLPLGYSVKYISSSTAAVTKKDGNIWILIYNKPPKTEEFTIQYVVIPGKRKVEDPTICGVLDFSFTNNQKKEKIEISTAPLFKK